MSSIPVSPPAALQRLPRLASFRGHLFLDGYGPTPQPSSAARENHPFFGKWPYNVGDQFVSMAIARLLKFEEFYTIEPGASQDDFDRINRECDIFLIRGSNFIYPGFFAKCMPVSLLSRIKIPIVYIGAGVQFSIGQDAHLLPEDIDSLKFIHASSASSSVRGYRIAEVLNRYGIKNVRPVGCPTILWPRTPTTRIAPPSFKRVGFTITDMNTKPDLKRRQFDLMEQLWRKAQDFTVFPQGGEVVLQSYIFCRDGVVTENRIEREISPGLVHCKRELKTLEAQQKSVRYYYRDVNPGLVKNMLDHAFFSNAIPDYLRRLRAHTFVAGTRLHGNMMALSQGVPALFAMHDQRLMDMVELLKVPAIDLMQDHAEVDLSQLSWTHFEESYARIFQETIAFLAENNLAHNLELPPPSAPQPSSAAATAQPLEV